MSYVGDGGGRLVFVPDLPTGVRAAFPDIAGWAGAEPVPRLISKAAHFTISKNGMAGK
jgi:hypothetical protein